MYALTAGTKFLYGLENSSSFGMFCRDTGGCLLAKLAVSRSKDEAKEISFAEISESLLFYFSAPALAKLGANAYSKLNNISKEELLTPFNELKNIANPDTVKKIKTGKFSQIMSTFSLILPLVFGIAPIRNYLTLANSGNDEFTGVIGLKKEEKEKQQETAKEKGLSLIKKLGISALIGLGLTFGAGALLKNDNIYKKTEPFLDKFLKHLDFSKTGDLEISHYASLIYPVSIASYFYASRDKYERAENARRFSITVPMMFLGEKVIEKPIHKFFDNKFGSSLLENGKIKSYDEILKLPIFDRAKNLKAKNFAWASTFFINTFLIAGAVALLNRFETKRKFNRDNNNG